MNPRKTDDLRAEARAWVQKLKDAHDLDDRARFKAWVEQSPAHRRAYDEVGSAYDVSSLLRTSPIGRARNLNSAFAAPSGLAKRSFAIISIAALAVIGGFALTAITQSLGPVPLESVMLATGAQAKEVILADGSKVSMAPATKIKVSLERYQRRVEIAQGIARIAIASEQRPFLIIAGSSKSEATMGTFEARLGTNGGSIEKFGAGNQSQTQPEPHANAIGQAQALEFDGEPLGEAIERINHLPSGPKLSLAPGLEGRRVTGVFKKTDRRAIADALALAFGLTVKQTSSDSLLLSPTK